MRFATYQGEQNLSDTLQEEEAKYEKELLGSPELKTLTKNIPDLKKRLLALKPATDKKAAGTRPKEAQKPQPTIDQVFVQIKKDLSELMKRFS